MFFNLLILTVFANEKKCFLFVCCVCTMCLFAACSDDDDDNKVLTVNDIVGTYAGSLDVAGTALILLSM